MKMANFFINKSILGGRLTADPELKNTPTGIAVCSFTLAVNRRFAKEGEQASDFINCVAWRQTAEFITKYFKKGSSLCVVGAIQTRSWTDNNGQKRYATEVVVDEAMFVDGKNDAKQEQGAQPTQTYIPDAYTAPQGNFAPVAGDDSDLPF
jgi:single-strand DNA-binding protein